MTCQEYSWRSQNKQINDTFIRKHTCFKHTAKDMKGKHISCIHLLYNMLAYSNETRHKYIIGTGTNVHQRHIFGHVKDKHQLMSSEAWVRIPPLPPLMLRDGCLPTEKAFFLSLGQPLLVGPETLCRFLFVGCGHVV